LLSLTVFLNMVAETMPATSDAVPLLGKIILFTKLAAGFVYSKCNPRKCNPKCILVYIRIIAVSSFDFAFEFVCSSVYRTILHITNYKLQITNNTINLKLQLQFRSYSYSYSCISK